jgi:hypothetical protein
MTWFDHSRRAASVLLVIIFLLAVPAVANAKFTAKNVAPLSVGTDRMDTPSGISGIYRCTRSGNTESMSVTINTFTDNGPTGSTYGFGLAIGSSIQDTAYSSVKKQTLEASRSSDNSATTWTVGIQGYLENWSSDIGTEDITCPKTGSKTANF